MISTEEYVSQLIQMIPFSSNLLNLHKTKLDADRVTSLFKKSALEIIPSKDGIVSVVQELGDPLDFSRQSTFFDFHKDGLYLPKVPDFVILYCVNPGHSDTPTIFADTRMVIKKMQGLKEFEVLRRLEMVYLGKDESIHPHPLIANHPRSFEAIITLGARGYIRPQTFLDRSRQTLSLREITLAMNRLFEELDKSVTLRHSWSKGDIILFDNNTYVHGRYAKKRDQSRKLLRLWCSLTGPCDSKG